MCIEESANGLPFTRRPSSHASAYVLSVTAERVGSSHVPRAWSTSTVASHFAASVLLAKVSGAVRSRPSALIGLSDGHPRHAGELHDFVSGMEHGDAVIGMVRVADSDEVLVGTVVGSYEYRPDIRPDEPHQRTVEWHGRATRAQVAAAGVELPPGLSRLAIGRLEDGRLAHSIRSSPSQEKPARQVGEAAARVSSLPAGPLAVSDIPLRSFGPLHWIDLGYAAEAVVACPEEPPCRHHTVHRYLLDVALPSPTPDGPHILIVGANPSCPDRPQPGGRSPRFVLNVSTLAASVGAASCGVVNLLTRRTASLDHLEMLVRNHPDAEMVGGRQQGILDAALERADLVVLAYGHGPRGGKVGARMIAEKESLLRRLRGHDAPLTATVGPRESHPSRNWGGLPQPPPAPSAVTFTNP